MTNIINRLQSLYTDDVETNEAIDLAIKVLEERLQGEWKTVEGYDGDEYYECSNCGEPWILMAGTPKDNNMNFCPVCGADMRKEED